MKHFVERNINNVKEVLLNPHGSDETQSIIVCDAKMCLLNPHGSDETVFSLTGSNMPSHLLNPHGSDETCEKRK